MVITRISLLSIIVLIFSISCRKRALESDNGHLKAAISSGIDSIDPAISYDTVSGTVVYQVYEQLYQYNYLRRPFTIEPLLAEGMPIISGDKKTVTIKIKKNVYYHDDPSLPQGRKLRAQDFITQIKRLAFIPTKSTGSWIYENILEGYDQFRAEAGTNLKNLEQLEIKGLKAIDDHTLQFKLTRPFPQLKYVLAMSFNSPIPIESVKFYDNIMETNMIGTGPFFLKKWIKSSKVELERFKNYRNEFYPSTGDRYAHKNQLLNDKGRKIPFLDKITLNVIKEDSTRWLNFRAKKIDYLPIPKDNFSSVLAGNGEITEKLKSEGVDMQVAPTQTYWWLAFNMEHSILGKNKNLRKAFAHAIDREKLIELFTNNRALKANSIYPPSVFGYESKHKVSFKYDINEAKRLLALAGYPNGKGLPEFKFDTRGVSATNRQQAEFIKSELKKINVNIRISINSFPAYLEKARKGDLEFWIDGWAMDYPDAENSLQLLYSKNHPPGPNSSYYDSQEFDQLFDEVKVLQDGADKLKVLNRAHNLVQEDFPWAMLFYTRSYLLYSKRLKNFRYSSSINNFFKYIKK